MNLKNLKQAKLFTYFGFRKPKSEKKGIKGFLSKLSQAFMLPISVLPIAGLILGIGGAIGANAHGANAQEFANFLKGMTNAIFANLAILFCASVAMAFTTKNSLYAVFIAIIAYLVFTSVQSAFIHFNDDNSFKDIFYFHKDSALKYMVGDNLGIKSMQTSIFGGVLVGAIVAFCMNRYSEYQLPLALNFFSGVRLVPIIMIPVATVLSLFFLLLWPFVGSAISWFGNATSKAPAGLDGLIYGMIGRALMPFGLHHIVIGMAFQSSLGGNLSSQDLMTAATKLGVENTDAFKSVYAELVKDGRVSIAGDQNIWNFINSLPYNRLPLDSAGVSTQPVFEWFSQHVGIYAGRFTQDYPTYIGACIGLGAAMIFAAEKQNRKKTAAIIGSSMLVAFLTGITEPLEFSFLFVAPLFYYIVYVPLSGLSYMMMKVTGAHVGVGFARGFMDLIIYGAIPVAKGTHFWWAFIFAPIEALISFVTFYFGIKKFNWETPGRGANEIKLINKAQYKELIKKGERPGVDGETENYIEAYGGKNNIVNIAACATRLRITVKDPAKIDKDKLKAFGSMGFIEKGSSSQNILGGAAAVIASKMQDAINASQGELVKAQT